MEARNQLWPGWETVGVLGAGGFGSVYEIQRDVFGRTERAALKTVVIPQHAGEIEELRQEGYDNASITARFRSYLEDIVREYNMMAELKGCANIVYCDDLRYVQHEDGFGWNLYIKMELLTPLLKALPLRATEEQVIQLGIDMCNALALCRIKNIVHRDIKPQNIFVSNMGDYKLGDFGIAKTSERTASGTKTGTYKFMAPEVYNNQPYGISVDQYSLGLVLYWLLNERRSPFVPLPPTVPRPGDEEEARYRRMSGQPIPEPLYGSRELKNIVLKACAFRPQDRFETPEEMCSALQALQYKNSSRLQLEEDDEQEGTVGVWSGGRKIPHQDDGHEKEDDETQRAGLGKVDQETPEKDPAKDPSVTPKLDLDIRTTVELTEEQARTGCTVVVTLPHLGEKIQVPVPAAIQNGQSLRIAGKGKSDPQSGLTGSLLVTVKILPAKEPIKTSETPGKDAKTGGKPKLFPKKQWSDMTDEELRAYIAFKNKAGGRGWLALLIFFAGIFIGIGTTVWLGYAMWFYSIYLVFGSVKIKRNAKNAEQEYFNRRKK